MPPLLPSLMAFFDGLLTFLRYNALTLSVIPVDRSQVILRRMGHSKPLVYQ